MKLKNVRAGIVIIADAGLKLAPGETVEVENPTSQVQNAIIAGLLARIDVEPDTKPKSKSANRAAENKTESKKPSGSQKSEQRMDSDESSDGTPAETGQGQLLGAGDDAN